MQHPNEAFPQVVATQEEKYHVLRLFLFWSQDQLDQEERPSIYPTSTMFQKQQDGAFIKPIGMYRLILTSNQWIFMLHGQLGY